MKRSILFGIILVFLFGVLACDHGQAFAYPMTSGGNMCLTFESSFALLKSNSVLSVLIFALSVLLAIGKRLSIRFIHSNVFALSSFLSYAARQKIYKLFDPIQQALRRGILQPQIYNFALANRFSVKQ